MAGSLPYLKLFVADYLAEPSLRAVSLAARGLWTTMLLFMHQAERRGYLEHRGEAMTSDYLAKQVGVHATEVESLWHEMEREGVFSRENGVIFCRRMVRETRKSALCKEAGKRGGNPALGLRVTLKGDPLDHPSDHPSSSMPSNGATLKGQGQNGPFLVKNPRVTLKGDPSPNSNSNCHSQREEEQGGARVQGNDNQQLPPPNEADQEIVPDDGTLAYGWVEKIWNAYPRHAGKVAGVEAIEHAIRLESTRRRSGIVGSATWLLARVHAYSRSDVVKLGKVMACARWFRERCYEDDDRSWQNAQAPPTATLEQREAQLQRDIEAQVERIYAKGD